MPSAEAGAGAGAPPDDAFPVFTPLGEETVLQSRFISVRRARFRDPDGVPFERDIVRHPGAVAIVAVTPDRKVVLVQQYRPPVDGWLLEIPAGTCDVEGEPPDETAHRELAEEVGYAAEKLTLLTKTLITPGFCDEVSRVYLATGLRPVAPARQGVEERFLRVHEVPLDDFDGMVDDGKIVDATTILGVALARRRLDRTG